MQNEEKDLAARTKNFARRIIRLYCALPKETVAQVLGIQALRSGTSVEPIILRLIVRVQRRSSFQKLVTA